MAAANAGRINHAEPSPIDNSVLSQQANHRSEAIWNRTLTCRSRSKEFSNREPMVDDRVVNIIKALGLEGILWLPGVLFPYLIVSHTCEPRNGVYTVGDFMTRKEDLHVVKPTMTVDEAFLPTALEALVENRITGFPIIDDNWKLVGLVSDYDLLALDSISCKFKISSYILPFE
nr:cbs domain-containing protein cbsx1, chloroplastic [Quercus suber]